MHAMYARNRLEENESKIYAVCRECRRLTSVISAEWNGHGVFWM